MTDFRALCAELIHLDDEQPSDYADWKRRWNAVANRARAALAEPHGEGPKGRPAPPLALQPMRRIYINNPTQIAECGGPCTEGGPEACDCGALWRDEPALAEPQGDGPKGRPAPPLADGEVGELVAALRSEAIHCTYSTLTSGDLRRAADLLTRLALQPVPAPVAADIRYEFSVMDSDYVEQAGGSAPTIEQARDEGLHYLAQYSQDGPHALELRRVEILSLPSEEEFQALCPQGYHGVGDDDADGEVEELVEWLPTINISVNAGLRSSPSSSGPPPACLAPSAHVPVSERLPGVGDCDAEGRCWIHMPDFGTAPSWRLVDPREIRPYHTHWLPFHALPLPREVQP